MRRPRRALRQVDPGSARARCAGSPAGRPAEDLRWPVRAGVPGSSARVCQAGAPGARPIFQITEKSVAVDGARAAPWHGLRIDGRLEFLAPPCLLHESFISRLVHCIAMHSPLSHPGPSTSAPAGSSGPDSRRRRQLRITAAACRCRAARYPISAALEQRSCAIRRKVGASRREAGGNL